MASVALPLIGKPGCHLSHNPRAVVQSVMEELSTHTDAPAVSLREVSILDDEVLFERHVEEIPVLLIDGAVHNFWRIDPERLRTAILMKK